MSGMREDCDIAVFIDINRAIQAGIKFVQSSNGVILTNGDETEMLVLHQYHCVIFCVCHT